MPSRTRTRPTSYAITATHAARIRKALRRRAITHAALAEELGVTAALVTQVANRAIARTQYLPAIYEVLGLPLYELYPLDPWQVAILEGCDDVPTEERELFTAWLLDRIGEWG